MSRPRKTIAILNSPPIVVKVDHPENPGRVAKQVTRLAQLGDMGFPVARLIWADGPVALFDRVHGPTLHDVQRAGPLSEVQADALTALHAQIAAAGLRVHDLNPKNLIWRAGGLFAAEWVIVDCGAVTVINVAKADAAQAAHLAAVVCMFED